MTNITRFDPFAELVRYDPFRDLESMFRFPRAAGRTLPEAPAIRMDVIEDEKGYRVKAEIPGVKKEDIQVSIEGNQVSISAEMKKESELKKGETVVRSERYYGNQYRGFSLPLEVDPARSEAKYESGVLELFLPRKEGAATTRVAVK
jgi:HSP20 family protein